MQISSSIIAFDALFVLNTYFNNHSNLFEMIKECNLYLQELYTMLDDIIFIEKLDYNRIDIVKVAKTKVL
jgi:hypothetical protein